MNYKIKITLDAIAAEFASQRIVGNVNQGLVDKIHDIITVSFPDYDFRSTVDSFTTLFAVNVKARHYPSAWKVSDHFGIPEDDAEELLETVFESSREYFWEQVQDVANEIFPCDTKVYSAGRSGGWVVVWGLPDISYWDAIDLAKWRKFERICKAMRDFYCSWEYVTEEVRVYLDNYPKETPGMPPPC